MTNFLLSDVSPSKQYINEISKKFTIRKTQDENNVILLQNYDITKLKYLIDHDMVGDNLFSDVFCVHGKVSLKANIENFSYYVIDIYNKNGVPSIIPELTSLCDKMIRRENIYYDFNNEIFELTVVLYNSETGNHPVTIDTRQSKKIDTEFIYYERTNEGDTLELGERNDLVSGSNLYCFITMRLNSYHPSFIGNSKLYKLPEYHNGNYDGSFEYHGETMLYDMALFFNDKLNNYPICYNLHD